MATAEGYFNTVGIFLAILLWVIALNIKRKQIYDIYINKNYKRRSNMMIRDDYDDFDDPGDYDDFDDPGDYDDNIDWDMVNDFYGGDLNDYYNVEQ